MSRTRNSIIQKLKSNYFDVRELVGPRVYKKFDQQSWQVFDTDTLHCLLIIREYLDTPFTVNTWHKGGKFKQRGFRSNISDLSLKKTLKDILYTSGHVMGKAIDFVPKDMTATEARKMIKELSNVLPCKIRLERKINGKEISWVHFDIKQIDKLPKVYEFDI